MMMCAWNQRALGAVLVVASSSLCASAYASGFDIAHFGGEHGTVVDTNPTALYYNPAGIGFSEGLQLFVDGQLALRSLDYTHKPGVGDVADPPGLEGANYGTAHAFNTFAGPMLGATWKPGNLAFGAAVYAPFGGQVSFDRNERFASSMYPGAADSIARWHVFDGSLMSIYTTVGVAYRLGPVSVGVTGNLVFSSVAFKRAESFGPTGGNDLSTEGRGSLDVSGVHASFGVGAMFEALPNTLWLSASYQAQPGLGAMKMQGTLELDPTPGVADETATRKVDFHQALPDVLRLGARFKPSTALELRLMGNLTRWSVQQTQCVALENEPCTVLANGATAPGSGAVANLRRRWDDSVGVQAGASYWVIPAVELMGGVGYETAAVPDSTLEPGLADADNVKLALGGRVQLAGTWFVGLTYTHLLFLTRDTTGKSDLANPEVSAPTRQPDSGGVYSQWVGIFDANLMKTF